MNHKKTFLSLFSIIIGGILLVIGVLTNGSTTLIVDSAGFNFEKEPTKLVETKLADTITSIDFNVAYSDLVITEGDEFCISYESSDVVIDNMGNTLRIQSTPIEDTYLSIDFVSSSEIASPILLMIPSDASFDDLSLTVSSGNIEISDVTCQTLSIINSYGDITILDSTVEQLISTGTSGDFTSKNSALGHTTIISDYGDVHLNLPGLQDDYSFSFDIGYGEISFDDSYVLTGTSVLESGDKMIDLTLGSGDATVAFTEN